MKSTTTKSIRLLLWIIITLGGLAMTFFILNSSPTSHSTPIPADAVSTNTLSPDEVYLNVQLSDKGLFKVAYTVSTGTIPVNQMHQWTLHVETADGQLVENATIAVDGDMPAHGHGLPTQPRVTKYLGDGNYLVEGMKFQMGGWWVMDFTITANEQTDTVHFGMQLK